MISLFRSPPRERRDDRRYRAQKIPVLPNSATFLVIFAALLSLGATTSPLPRTLSLAGTLTNTTADASGQARLALAVVGDTVTATLKTEPPLSGSGELKGHLRNGWLELSGKLTEGFTLQLRGALNTRDYRGTYLAAVPRQPIQYGKFHLTVE